MPKVPHHIGVGLASVEAVEAMKDFLVAAGAQIVSSGPRPKYFLRLNPDDVTQFEIFLSDEPTMHVDFTVGALEEVEEEYDRLISYEGLQTMLFLDLPGTEKAGLSVQIAFAERDS